MSDTCKFCGAEGVKEDPFFGVVFRCNTRTDYSARGADCLVGIARRYEALFPIPPLSTQPITAEVCERLGMIKNDELSWHIEDFWCCVRYYEDVKRWEVAIEGKCQRWCVTAGQLARLIAARKGAVK